MRVPAFLSVILAAVVVSLDAQTVPEVKLPPSPQGQASVQVAGRWEKTPTGGQRYVDGKWLVVDYGRPLLRGRANIFGTGADYGKTISDGSPVWRVGANDTTRLTTQVPLAINSWEKSWTAVDRMRRGLPLIVPGDGSSLWKAARFS